MTGSSPEGVGARVAAPTGTPAVGLYLVVSAGDRLCALDAHRVAEIVLPRAMATVPAAGASVHGAMFFRGECVTVFDLSQTLAGRPAERERAARVVVLRDPARAGIFVSAVLGLTPGPEESVVEDTGLRVRDRSWSRGIVRWNEHPVGVLDVARLMAPEPAVLDPHTGSATHRP